MNPIHFLLVEDDDDHADLIQMALADNRVANTYDRVADGHACMAYLRNLPPYETARQPDIILLDLRMPRMDGNEVLAEIKHAEDFRNIPVVVLTTSAAESDKARAYDNRANSYIVKPVDFEKFHQMVRDLELYWTACNCV